MKVEFLLKNIFFIMIVLVFGSCRNESATKREDDSTLVYLSLTDSKTIGNDGRQQDLGDDQSAKSFLVDKKGGIQIVLVDDVSVERATSFIRNVIRPTDISVTLRSDLAESSVGGKSNRPQDTHLEAIFEFPLADDNTKHWQYKVFDKLEQLSESNPSGYDKENAIAYIRMGYTKEGFFIGKDRVSLKDVISRIDESQMGGGKAAIGIFIGDKTAPIYPLVKMMNLIQKRDYKVIVVE